MISDRILRVSDAAEILKVSPMQVIKWCDSGHLPCVKVGVSRRIKEADLEFISPSERGPQKLKVAEPERPIYDGPPADECGFDSAADEEERRRQFKIEWEAAQIQIAAIKAKRAARAAKAPDPVINNFGSQSTIGRYPSGFGTK